MSKSSNVEDLIESYFEVDNFDLLCQAYFEIVDHGLVLSDIKAIDQNCITMVNEDKIPYTTDGKGGII